MKNLFYAMAAIAVLALAGCEKEETTETNFDGTYVGTVTVSGENVATFVDQGVKWQLVKEADNTITLKLNQTKFAERMPLLDMEVRNLPASDKLSISNSKFKYSHSTGAVIPYYAGTEMPRYEMTGFSLAADNNNLTVSFICTGLQVEYSGNAIKE